METVLAIATIVGGIPALWFFWDKILLWFGKPKVRSNYLTSFILEGQELKKRKNEDPLPIKEHNDWVEKMNLYFQNHSGKGFEVRVNDFSGMTFYGDGSEKSKYANSIDGRLRRLHEFLKEI